MDKNKFYLHTSNDDEFSFHEQLRQINFYTYHKGKTFLPIGWDSWVCYENADTGFYSEIVYKENTIVMCVRGTESMMDLKNDIAMSIKRNKPAQYYDAKKVYTEIKMLFPKARIVLTGHSLGGSCVALLGTETGEETITFSAFGVKYLLDSPNIDTSNIVNYGVYQDNIFRMNITEQIGAVRIIDTLKGYGHFLENYNVLDKNYEIKNGKVKEYISDNKQENDYNIFIKNLINCFMDKNTDCLGIYPVSSYVRNNGQEVSGYFRSCWKHK